MLKDLSMEIYALTTLSFQGAFVKISVQTHQVFFVPIRQTLVYTKHKTTLDGA